MKNGIYDRVLQFPPLLSCVLISAVLAILLDDGARAQNSLERNPLRPAEANPQEAEVPVAVADENPQLRDENAVELGEPLEEPAGRELLTAEEIEERLNRVDTLDLTEDVASNAKKYYQDALQITGEIKQQQQIADEAQAAYEEQPDADDKNGPNRFTKAWYEKRLAMPIDQVLGQKPVDLKETPSEVLEQRATKLGARLSHWGKIAKDLEAEPNLRNQWLSDLPGKRQSIEQKIAEIKEQLKKIGQVEGADEETEAQRVLALQTLGKLKAELLALQVTRAKIQRAEALYDLEVELAKRKVARYEELLGDVRNELIERRKRAATEQANLAQREASRNKQLIDLYPNLLGEIARNNVALTEELKNLVAAIDRAQQQHDEDTRSNNSIEASYEKFKAQFGDSDKLTQVSGQLLRDQRAKLPRVARLKADLARYQSERSDINFRRFEANQRLDELQDLDSYVNRLLREFPAEDRQEARGVLRDLLESQKKYLKSYVAELDKLDTDLAELISEKTRLLNNTTEFREFIAKRDLWIRSCRPLWASQIRPGQGATSWRPFYLKPALGALAWSLNPNNWLQVGLDLRRAALRQPLAVGALALAFAILFFAQQRSRALIKVIGKQAASKSCTEFLPSLRAVWLTAIVSLPWPLALWSIGWLLDGPWVEAEFTRALALAARYSAWFFLFAEFLRQCCRTDGLAEAHLGWPRAALLQLRRYLRWIPAVVVPLVFWFIGLDMQTTQPLWSASLGRVLFIVVMALLSLTLWRLLLSRGSAIFQSLQLGSDNWLLNLHRGWRPALAAVPLLLALLSIVGYYYTAQQLTLRMVTTGAMLLGLMIAGGLLRRWVLLNRRGLAREHARQRRAQAIAAAEAAGQGGEPPPPTEMADINIEDSVDLTALSAQTQKLLRMLLLVCGVFGAIFLWQDVFPALAWLDENPLPGLAGTSARPTTWGHLLRCLLALAVTYVAVRDLPGLLELVVLQHLPLDQGVRYAVSTLARYALLILGIVVAAASVGITGTSISWLVAAMGVGLGFGLQEIFANFVSGIILLFERPIRVGDIVTLGDKTGIVNRIRMRATTIVDWDRKEYVVPNKDLVTERLLNWTLSDQTNRIVVQVGVAYGTDTDKACGLLSEAATEHAVVLDDPPPVITFESFGDSTLNLTLRCYLPNLDNRLQTIHELHTAINNKFNAAGIEIAFPQQDLHIRSIPQDWSKNLSGAEELENGRVGAEAAQEK